MSSIEENWLKKEDESCRTERLKRLAWINREYPNDILLITFSGIKSKYLFEEARYCFVYGQYIAVILLSMAYIESMLAARYYMYGDNDTPFLSISKMLTKAKEDYLLTEEEYEVFDNIREIRNPLTHFKKPLDKKSLEAISLEEQHHPYGILENDARKALKAMFKLMQKPFI